jgi:hypothetical protein
MQGSIQLILPLQNTLILPSAVNICLCFANHVAEIHSTDSGGVMSDTIRTIFILSVFLIAFPAFYIFFKAADPFLKSIVGAAVFLFPCFLLLWEDLVRFEKSSRSHRLEKD